MFIAFAVCYHQYNLFGKLCFVLQTQHLQIGTCHSASACSLKELCTPALKLFHATALSV